MCTLQYTFKTEYNDPNNLRLNGRILKGQREPIPVNFSADMKNMVDSLLCLDPTRRPSAGYILKMPFIK
jgi:hypothetical protein